MKRRIFSIILCFSLLFSILPSTAVFAAYDNGYDGTMAGEGSGIFAHGVDLSEWQGDEVDFHKIKEQGYSFVILRAGFATTIDDCFEGNYARAKEAGLDVGVYLYSYADNKEEALLEAEAMLGWLSGKQLEYPVYYDLEDPKCHGNMSVEQLTEIAFTFLDLLSAAGWLVGIYSCKSWLETKFDTASIGQTYECWMAQFVSSGTYDIYDRYDEVYGMWQYSCTGTVEGVPGGVDMNVCFKDYPGICRLYGFNGYSASDESLILSDAQIPVLLKRGEQLKLNGKVISTKGDLNNVTIGIYGLDGQLLTGRSVGPKSRSIDLADLGSGLRSSELAEGTYLCRITASNEFESLTLMNQTLVISDSGICLQEATLPKDLKVGQYFSLTGVLLCASEMREITAQILDSSGNTVQRIQTTPHTVSYDLAQLPLNFTGLPLGEYQLKLEILTDQAFYRPVDAGFFVWSANDPIRLEQLQLQSEYFPGEFDGLSGEVVSAYSAIRQLNIEILDNNGTLVKRLISMPGKAVVSLADYNSRLDMGALPIGVYSIRISALNDGGPKVLLEQRFLIREDSLGLCDPLMPTTIYYKDSYSIGGVAFSDVTSLTYVGLTVTDEWGNAVLSAGAVPNRSIYDLSQLNDSLHFSSLACGKYNLKVVAENENRGAVLYSTSFLVAEHTDIISWTEPCGDPNGIAYCAASGYYLTGEITSAESSISGVSVEILRPEGNVVTSAFVKGDGRSLSLESCNEQLRFSALPEGDYILRINASNAMGSFELLHSAFSVTDCPHRSTRSGAVIQPGCNTCGVVTDSRCQDCGEKVRSGFSMEPIGHQEQEGRCLRCGKTGFLTVAAKLCTQIEPYGRYVIAYTDGTSWYALAWDGSAVKIPAPDATGTVELNAGLLWSIEAYSGGYLIRNPFGLLLHLDQKNICVARGTENGIFNIQLEESEGIFTLADASERCLTFDGNTFTPGSEPMQFVMFSYSPEK